MKKLKTIILEHLEQDRTNLKRSLGQFQNDVEVIFDTHSLEELMYQIQNSSLDLIFLDLDMPGKSGFHFLEQLEKWDFEVIFTTSTAQHALKAFNWNIADYLLKPISDEELYKTIQKILRKINVSEDLQRFNKLKDSLPKTFNKLSLPTATGFVFVDINEIIRCKASSNYTHFYLISRETILVSRTLKHYENLLSKTHFVRINRTDLINTSFVKQMIKGKKSLIELEDGTRLVLSDSRKDEFNQKIN